MLSLYPEGVKRGDWGRIAEFIEDNERPNQPIMVFTTFDALCLPPHYNGVNRVLPDERYFSYGLEGPPGSAESLVSETDFFISEIPESAEQIWLALNEKCLGGDACRPLQNYIDANYTIGIEKDFYLERLYLLNRKRE
jgi:hypothetical protein